MEKLLPILSGSLREVIESVSKKYDCKIAKEVLKAHDFTELYNRIVDGFGGIELEYTLPYIKEIIDDLRTNAVSMLSYRQGTFEISFLPEGREPKYTSSGNWSKENRQVGKPTRIIQKLLKQEYKTRDLELFNNWLRAEMQGAFNFEIVSGADITKWYHQCNYFKLAGTLGNSCMQHDRCSSYFKVYEDNAKMLITTKDGKLTGRALLWEIDGKTYMDRIYTCFDFLENNFIEHAESEGWYHRSNNSLLHTGDDQYWLGPENHYIEPKRLCLAIKLKNTYTKMPYVDSFRYYDYDDNYLLDYNSEDCDTIALDSTDGEICDDYHRMVTCEVCGRTLIINTSDDSYDNDIIYSEFIDGYICKEHCYNATGLMLNGTPFLVPNTVESVNVHITNNEQAIFPKELVENTSWTELNQEADPEDYGFVFLNGEWWDLHHKRVIFDGEYKLKDIEDGDTTRLDTSSRS